MQQVLQSFNYAQTLTKSDTVNSPRFPTSDGRYPDAIWVGDAGTVILVFDDASTVTVTCAAGTLLPIRAKRCGNSGTSALLVGLWQA
jgi:hypothetical protein